MSRKAAILHPKYWPAWVVVAVFRCLVLLPIRWQLCLGRIIGRCLHGVFKSRVKIVERNLAACFPKLSVPQRATLNKQVFQSMGLFLMEGNMAYYMRESRFNRRIQLTLHGYEHFRQARETGQGVIILSGHMMVLEIIARLFAQEHDFAVVYRANSSPFYNLLINRGRAKHIHKMIDRNDLKTMVKWLRAGKILWYAPDQDFGRDRSVFADFMGVQTATLKAIADLARLGKAVVVPGLFNRTDVPGQYEGHFFPAFEHYPSGDYVKDVGRYNQVLGDFVRQHPEQYNWLHRRFKTRPQGEAPFYT